MLNATIFMVRSTVENPAVITPICRLCLGIRKYWRQGDTTFYPKGTDKLIEWCFLHITKLQKEKYTL